MTAVAEASATAVVGARVTAVGGGKTPNYCTPLLILKVEFLFNSSYVSNVS
jgi:hypothetical protein